MVVQPKLCESRSSSGFKPKTPLPEAAGFFFVRNSGARALVGAALGGLGPSAAKLVETTTRNGLSEARSQKPEAPPIHPSGTFPRRREKGLSDSRSTGQSQSQSQSAEALLASRGMPLPNMVRHYGRAGPVGEPSRKPSETQRLAVTVDAQRPLSSACSNHVFTASDRRSRRIGNVRWSSAATSR